MKPFVLLPLAILMCACQTADTSRTHSSVGSTSTTPAVVSALRLAYRTYDGSQYGLAVANADGSKVVKLSGPNFVHPDLIRFVQSRNRRWAAWADGGDLRVAASSTLSSASTVATSSKPVSVLAVSDDGETIVYEILTPTGPEAFTSELYVEHLHDRSIKLLRTLAGSFITCLGDGAFDVTAQRLIAVGCGSGQAAGLLILNASDGSIISEDDKFFAWPGQWAFASDLKTVWLVVDGTTESDIVRYDTATRTREVLYRSPVWRQSDGSIAPNLAGPVLLAPDESELVFSRYAQGAAPEVLELPSAGGTSTMIFKSTTFGGLLSWYPNRYVAISVDNSTPTQRIRLIEPLTKTITAVDTGTGYVEFLAWVTA